MGVLGRLGRQFLRASRLADQLLPSQNEAAQALADVLKEARAAVPSRPETELTDDSRSRLRYRGAPLQMFLPWGATVSRAFSLYWRILQAPKRRELHVLLTAAKMFRTLDEDTTFNLLKKISSVFFKYQDMLSANWRDYVHLHLLRDYQVAKPISEMRAEVVDWTQSRPVHKLFGSKDLFLTQFKLGVRDFLKKAPCRLDSYTPLTNEEFVSDPMHWATSGSSTSKTLPLELDGKTVNAKKTKWASALALDQGALLRMLTEFRYQENHVIQKRELGKVRPVVASDFITNLKMARAGHWLESALAGHEHSTLFMTSKQQYTLWQDMVIQAQDQLLIKMPIDQGHFDHSVGADMISIINDELSLFINERCNTSDKQELLDVMVNIKHAVSKGKTKLGDEWIEYFSGICSGWRFTALYDTLANSGELFAVRQFIRSKSGYDPVVPTAWVCQGDDIRLLTTSYAGAVAIWQLYQEAGFDVNVNKFFISNKVDEFLRQVTRETWIAGYPARMASLVFRNPVTRELIRGEERIREMLTTWNQVFNRFGYLGNQAPWPMAVADIAKSNHIKQVQMLNYLATPACMGGAGTLTDYTPRCVSTWTSIGKGRITTNWKLKRTPPLAATLGRYTHVPAGVYTQQWLPNIEGPRNKTILEYSGFELVERVANWKAMPVPAIESARHIPLAPSYASAVSPSYNNYLTSTAVDSDDYSVVLTKLDTNSRAVLETLIFRGTRKVRKLWMLGRLPFNTPVRAGWSSLATSVLFTPLVRYAWANCFNYPRLTYPLVVSAALGAEKTLGQIEQIQSVRVGG